MSRSRASSFPWCMYCSTAPRPVSRAAICSAHTAYVKQGSLTDVMMEQRQISKLHRCILLQHAGDQLQTQSSVLINIPINNVIIIFLWHLEKGVSKKALQPPSHSLHHKSADCATPVSLCWSFTLAAGICCSGYGAALDPEEC